MSNNKSTCDSAREDSMKNYIANPSSPTGRLPCMDDYPGPHNFELLLDGATSHKKSWIVSINNIMNNVMKPLRKLYCIEAEYLFLYLYPCYCLYIYFKRISWVLLWIRSNAISTLGVTGVVVWIATAHQCQYQLVQLFDDVASWVITKVDFKKVF